MTYQRPRRVLAVAQPRAESRPAQTVAAALGCLAVLVAPFSAVGTTGQVAASAPVYTARPFAEVDAATALSLTASQRTQPLGDLPSFVDFGDAAETPLGQLSELTPNDLAVLSANDLAVLSANGLGTADAAIPADTGRYLAPVPGPITGPYGPRFHPILRYMRMHNGVDMTAACGTPVVAMANGTITRAGAAGGYGNLVEIDHGTLDEDRVASRYAHLSVVGVRLGNHVQRGQVIGLAGTTGLSTGCHLHFEVLLNGRFVDPAAVLAGAPHAQLVPMSQLPPMPTPSATPSLTPEPSATLSPSPEPSGTPTTHPTGTPTTNPTGTPTTNPTGTPTTNPTGTPTTNPTGTPTTNPTSTPTPDPAGTPSPNPSETPAPSPSGTPSSTPDPTGSTPPEPSVAPTSAAPASATPTSTPPTPKPAATTAATPPVKKTEPTAAAPDPSPTAEG